MYHSTTIAFPLLNHSNYLKTPSDPKKFTMRATLPTAALIASTNAQYYNITSKPFQLVVTSADGGINDTLSACHVGAALESLCLSNSTTISKPEFEPYSTFNFNTTIYTQPATDPSLGIQGILTFNLPAGQPPIPSSASFNYDPTTDIAVPILGPGDQNAQQLSFDDKDELLIQGYIDWAANPPKAGNFTAFKRWYACTTYFSGYEYDNLAWGLGKHEPEDPTCVKVTVKRVFL
jgi:hypothetical protein